MAACCEPRTSAARSSATSAWARRSIELFSEIVGAPACLRQPRTCSLSRGVVTDDSSGTVTIHLTASDPDFLFKLTEYAYAAPIPPGTPDKVVGRAPSSRDRSLPDRVRQLQRDPVCAQSVLPRVVTCRATRRESRRDRRQLLTFARCHGRIDHRGEGGLDV